MNYLGNFFNEKSLRQMCSLIILKKNWSHIIYSPCFYLAFSSSCLTGCHRLRKSWRDRRILGKNKREEIKSTNSWKNHYKSKRNNWVQILHTARLHAEPSHVAVGWKCFYWTLFLFSVTYHRSTNENTAGLIHYYVSYFSSFMHYQRGNTPYSYAFC